MDPPTEEIACVAEEATIYEQQEADYEELWGDIPFFNSDNNM